MVLDDLYHPLLRSSFRHAVEAAERFRSTIGEAELRQLAKPPVAEMLRFAQLTREIWNSRMIELALQAEEARRQRQFSPSVPELIRHSHLSDAKRAVGVKLADHERRLIRVEDLLDEEADPIGQIGFRPSPREDT